MLVTLLFFTAYLICQLGSLAHGNGRHRATMTDATAQIGLMVSSNLTTTHTSLLTSSAVLVLLRAVLHCGNIDVEDLHRTLLSTDRQQQVAHLDHQDNHVL